MPVAALVAIIQELINQVGVPLAMGYIENARKRLSDDDKALLDESLRATADAQESALASLRSHPNFKPDSQ